MRTPQSHLSSRTNILIFFAIIAVASTLQAFKTITPQEAKNQIDTAQKKFKEWRNGTCPESSCLPALQVIYAEIDKNDQTIQNNKNQTQRTIDQSQEQLRSLLQSADAASQKRLQRILQLKTGILRNSVIILNQNIQEKTQAIQKLNERAELAQKNYAQCLNQCKTEPISCPACPKQQPCVCPQCSPPITCPNCQEPIVCPTCIQTDCSVFQRQTKSLKQKLAIAQGQLKTANDTIKTSKQAKYLAVASINASISTARQQLSEKLSVKNNGKLNATKLISTLTEIEKKATSNFTLENQIKQYEALVSELIYFIDAATTLAAQERTNKEKLLQNFKRAVGQLKQCNDYLHGKVVKSK